MDDALTEHSEALLAAWPQIQRAERAWRVLDVALPAAAVLAMWVFRDYWWTTFACGVMFGSTLASGQIRRRNYRQMKASMERLSMAVAYSKEIE